MKDSQKDLVERLTDEYKIVQDKIDKIGGFRFQVKGWAITIVVGALVAGTGELAAHVKTYGVWLLGSNDWACRSWISLRAVARKERRLELLIANARANWDKLHPLFRIKNQKTIRRELQRLCLLREGKPVPPTALLDRVWEDKHSAKISPDSAVSDIFIGVSLESALEAVYPTLALCPTFGLPLA